MNLSSTDCPCVALAKGSILSREQWGGVTLRFPEEAPRGEQVFWQVLMGVGREDSYRNFLRRGMAWEVQEQKGQ